MVVNQAPKQQAFGTKIFELIFVWCPILLIQMYPETDNRKLIPSSFCAKISFCLAEGTGMFAKFLDPWQSWSRIQNSSCMN